MSRAVGASMSITATRELRLLKYDSYLPNLKCQLSCSTLCMNFSLFQLMYVADLSCSDEGTLKPVALQPEPKVVHRANCADPEGNAMKRV